MTTDIPTIEELEKSLEENGHGGDGLKHAALLAASAIVGPDVEALCGFTHYELPFVLEVREQMLAAGTWRKDGTVAANWFDDEDGGIAFTMDTLVAMGMVLRVDDPEVGS